MSYRQQMRNPAPVRLLVSFMPYSLGCGASCDSSDILAWNVVCHKTKLVSILLKQEPNVSLLVIWTKQRKVLPLMML